MNSVITFDPPLKCKAIIGPDDQQCGKPATVGTLEVYSFAYFLFPLCRDCVQRLADTYTMGIANDLVTKNGAPGLADKSESNA